MVFLLLNFGPGNQALAKPLQAKEVASSENCLDDFHVSNVLNKYAEPYRFRLREPDAWLVDTVTPLYYNSRDHAWEVAGPSVAYADAFHPSSSQLPARLDPNYYWYHSRTAWDSTQPSAFSSGSQETEDESGRDV